MRRMFQRLSLGVLAGLVPATAAADPITITSVSRHVAVLARVDADGMTDRHAGTQSTGDSITLTMNAALPGNTATATSTLVTNVSDPAVWSGTGTNSAAYETTNGRGDVSASGELAVDFLLTTPHHFNYTADFTSSGYEWSERFFYERGMWQTTLSSLSPLFNFEGFDDARIERSGLLGPGAYRFYIGASAVAINLGPPAPQSVGPFGNFDFTFSLTAAEPPDVAPTPEPASLLLLGTGLAGVAAARRRVRRDAPV